VRVQVPPWADNRDTWQCVPAALYLNHEIIYYSIQEQQVNGKNINDH
jgi:hypothetical protein